MRERKKKEKKRKRDKKKKKEREIKRNIVKMNGTSYLSKICI
jgi:hypothetical protein